MALIPTMPDTIQTWDCDVLRWIQENLVCPFCDTFFKLVTRLGDGGIFWIIIAVIFLFFAKKRKTGIMMGVALLLGVIVVNGIIKNVCGRIRPYDFDATIKSVETLLISKPSDYSFPSGHTLACFECATVLMWKDKKFGIPALIIALLVSFSRLYLCVHYPTDVIFGAIFGIINGILGIVIVNAVYKLINKRFNKNFQ